jgi:hypothetical protein
MAESFKKIFANKALEQLSFEDLKFIMVEHEEVRRSYDHEPILPLSAMSYEELIEFRDDMTEKDQQDDCY